MEVNNKNFTPPPPPPPRRTQRWAFHFGSWQPTDEEWQQALALLPREEQERIGRFKRPTHDHGMLVGRHNPDAKSSLAGRLFILLAAAEACPGVPLSQLLVKRTPEGKPYLSPSREGAAEAEAAGMVAGKGGRERKQFNFNVSHAGEWVVLAAEPLDLVGADVMKVELRGRDPSIHEFFHCMRTCFTSNEWRFIRRGAGADDLTRFFMHWTLKEAYIKAVGVGLGFDLQRAEFVCSHGLDQAEAAPGGQRRRCATATIRIDGVARPEWKFLIESLDDHHIVAIARGPFAQAIDSFKACMGINGEEVGEEEEEEEEEERDRVWHMWTFKELMQELASKGCVIGRDH